MQRHPSNSSAHSRASDGRKQSLTTSQPIDRKGSVASTLSTSDAGSIGSVSRSPTNKVKHIPINIDQSSPIPSPTPSPTHSTTNGSIPRGKKKIRTDSESIFSRMFNMHSRPSSPELPFGERDRNGSTNSYNPLFASNNLQAQPRNHHRKLSAGTTKSSLSVYSDTTTLVERRRSLGSTVSETAKSNDQVNSRTTGSFLSINTNLAPGGPTLRRSRSSNNLSASKPSKVPPNEMIMPTISNGYGIQRAGTLPIPSSKPNNQTYEKNNNLSSSMRSNPGLDNPIPKEKKKGFFHTLRHKRNNDKKNRGRESTYYPYSSGYSNHNSPGIMPPYATGSSIPFRKGSDPTGGMYTPYPEDGDGVYWHDPNRGYDSGRIPRGDPMYPSQYPEYALDITDMDMSDIITSDYFSAQPTDAVSPFHNSITWVDGDVHNKWSPPESWAVQGTSRGRKGSAGNGLFVQNAEGWDEDGLTADMDETASTAGFSYSQDGGKASKEGQAYIRIFKDDATFTTLHCSMNTTVNELVSQLARKVFVLDPNEYGLFIKRWKLERILQPQEKPLQIQKHLLEQMGWTELDNLDGLGREDISYLVRFTFKRHKAPKMENEDIKYEHMNLEGRNLRTIPISLFHHSATIVSLDVSQNLLIELPTDFIVSCGALKELRLSNCDYTFVPPGVAKSETLEHLDISCNRIKDLRTSKLESITGLKSLVAFNNRLDELPDGFKDLTQITKLNISNNNFTSFPLVICQLRNLNELDISFNAMGSLPEDIGNLVLLTRFHAIANELSPTLPKGFSKLKNLRELDIRQNALKDLDVLAKLPSLETLVVDYNIVSIVNCEFRSLRQLKMGKNHLTFLNLSPSAEILPIRQEVWERNHRDLASNLTELNLSGCKLAELPDRVFERVTAIETLVLDYNVITKLPSSLSSLKKLVRLSVAHCLLQVVPAEISELTKLKILDMQHNNIDTLPREIWLCPALTTLNCSSNLLHDFPSPMSGSGMVNIALGSAANGGISLNPGAGQGIVPEMINDYSLTMDPNGTMTEAPTNFNPPAFFTSPRNHPPPLSMSLKHLFLGDNKLGDPKHDTDVFVPLSMFTELRTLNLSFNQINEVPAEGLCHQHLNELYLSGNQLTNLPADDIQNLNYLRVLNVNGNKLRTVPGELGKLRKLSALDVGSNLLRYNIANQPYDWHWKHNLGLKYLNLSGNKRFEINANREHSSTKATTDTDFSALTRLRVLGLMDVTINVVPEETADRRVRTSLSEVNSMAYGMADWLGPYEHLSTWDMIFPKFRTRDDECLLGLFDGVKSTQEGCKSTKFLNDWFAYNFQTELKRLKGEDTVVSALRRTFLSLDKELGEKNIDDKDNDKNTGASAVVCYVSGTKLYVANVGDALAVMSTNNGQAVEISKKHIPLDPSEVANIRKAGGFVSNSGLLNGELSVSRSFGYFHLIPIVNANPYIFTYDLSEQDEFIIIASKGLWDRMSYQTAVDIARTELEDLMLAAQKLRDFAIMYGAEDSIMVMILGVGDLFDRRNERKRMRNPSKQGDEEGSSLMYSKVRRNNKNNKDDVGDSALARLGREVPPPTGHVALVFTDIKNSTQLWETVPIAMRTAIKVHNSTMRRTLRQIGGYEVKTEGDAFMVSFPSVQTALLWCFKVQLALLDAEWPQEILNTDDGREIYDPNNNLIYRGLSVRMGMHWGEPVCEPDIITRRMDYLGPVVNKASRISSAADGGQICVSLDVVTALNDLDMFLNAPPSEDSTNEIGDAAQKPLSKEIISLRQLGYKRLEIGERKLKGLETPEILSFVYPKALAARIEMDREKLQKAKPTKPQPEENAQPQTLSPLTIRQLGILCHRLERVASGTFYPVDIEQLDQLMAFQVREYADDEELMITMENFVTRIENAASSLYLSKMGKFSGVLETLGTAAEIDPAHILRALQMYAQIQGGHRGSQNLRIGRKF